jgi:alpha-1,3-rhamnosyl/mannosyltransferase
VTSNNSCLPEVTGDAAVLVDPLDEMQIAGGIHKILQDETLRARLIEKGLARATRYRWLDAAEKTLQLYRESVLLNVHSPAFKPV